MDSEDESPVYRYRRPDPVPRTRKNPLPDRPKAPETEESNPNATVIHIHQHIAPEPAPSERPSGSRKGRGGKPWMPRPWWWSFEGLVGLLFILALIVGGIYLFIRFHGGALF